MRKGLLAALGLMLTLALTAGPAGAATTRPAERQARHATWETVAGVFRTHRAAEAMIKRLDAKNLKGFTIRTERMGRSRTLRYEDERTFPTQEQARAELHRLQQAGFHGRVVERRS